MIWQKSLTRKVFFILLVVITLPWSSFAFHTIELSFESDSLSTVNEQEVPYKRLTLAQNNFNTTTQYLNKVLVYLSDLPINEEADIEDLKDLHLHGLVKLREFSHHFNNYRYKMIKALNNKQSPQAYEIEHFKQFIKINSLFSSKFQEFELRLVEKFPEVILANKLARLSLAIDSYQTHFKNKFLRRVYKKFIKEDKSEFNVKSYSKLLLSLTKKSAREQMGIEYNKYIQSVAESNKNTLDYYKLIKSFKYTDVIFNPDLYTFKKYKFKDYISKKGASFLGKVSQLFGMVAGNIKFRQGYLFENKKFIHQSLSELQPLDIILEKSPFVLTDQFIPGHFGHAALWLGTKEQLLENGMWFHPVIIPFQEKIEQGFTIIEALRPGVYLNRLDQFLNIDHFMVTRLKKELSVDMTAVIYKRVLRNVGKDYDFNFDTLTDDKIVCSELLSSSFVNINWPTNYIFGRHTISPDNIAEVLFRENSPLKFVKYSLGKSRNRIVKKNKEELATDLNLRLINGSYSRIQKKCKIIRRHKRPNLLKCKTNYIPLDKNKK